VALYAQGLLGPRHRGGPATLVRRLGAVQLDTISVLARSHELVTFARCGPMSRTKIDRAYWGHPGQTFEYWSHAACLLPMEEWPSYAFRRRAFVARGLRWHRLEDTVKSCDGVLSRLRAEGPLTAKELGGAKRGGVWWDWSEVKIAAEWLLDIGQLVCAERRGFQRVYDLAERAVPSELLEIDLSDEECATRLVAAAGRTLGVATVADLAAYHGVPPALVRATVGETDLEPVQVQGWKEPAFVAPDAREVLERRVTGRSLLLSPFDSLVWFRPRTERLFGFRHRLEAYVPRHKRQYGYFAMPLLAGTKLVGLVDPGRDGTRLLAKQVSLFTRGATRHAALALADAASWVGCDAIEVDRVDPGGARAELQDHLARLL
jgi:uncharacterized protein